MSRTKISAALLVGLALCACSPTPDPRVTREAGLAAPKEEAREGEIRFHARIGFDRPTALPAGASIVAYVIRSNLESGARELVTQRAAPVPAESPAYVEIDIVRDALDPALGYEMSATMVDGDGEVIMRTVANRPPTPAVLLRSRNTFDLRLLSVATPAQPEEIFQLPGPLALTCGALEVDVRQEPGGDVLVSLPDGAVRLRPAAASSGGRFADRGLELWANLAGQSLLILPGQQPQACESR
jgi:hypothetical protein